jgi:hypothetical protein
MLSRTAFDAVSVEWRKCSFVRATLRLVIFLRVFQWLIGRRVLTGSIAFGEDLHAAGRRQEDDSG